MRPLRRGAGFTVRTGGAEMLRPSMDESSAGGFGVFNPQQFLSHTSDISTIEHDMAEGQERVQSRMQGLRDGIGKIFGVGRKAVDDLSNTANAGALLTGNSSVSNGVIGVTSLLSGLSSVLNARDTEKTKSQRGISAADATNAFATSASSFAGFGQSRGASIASKTLGIGAAATGLSARAVSARKHFKSGEKAEGAMSIARMLPQALYGIGAFKSPAATVGSALDAVLDYTKSKYMKK